MTISTTGDVVAPRSRVRAFIDTNVFVYAADEADHRKHLVAQSLIADESLDVTISAQVMSELYWALTRRLGVPMDPVEAAALVSELADVRVVPLDRALVRRAVETSIRHRISLWDAQIVEAASSSGCSVLYSEDLASGSVLRGVELLDPFATT